MTGTWNYTYDNLNRLLTGTSTAGYYSGAQMNWYYDPFGNRTNQVAGGTAEVAMPSSSYANYNVANQVYGSSQNGGGQFLYDAAGDVTYDGLNSYLYDGEGRICAVASTPVPGMTVMTGYLYDADGTRVAKGRITAWSCDPGVNGFQTTSDYILGPGGEQVTEMGMNANNSMAWQHTNVWAAGKLLATYDNDGLHFYLNDPLGTRRVQTDYAGNTEESFTSLPFGDQLSSLPTALATADDATEHHFTGKERDAESGNDYFEARYYSSAMGRFMSPDWSAKEEPVPYAQMDDPQTLNLYSYVRNNPLTRVDMDGHDPPLDQQQNITGAIRNIPSFSAATMSAFNEINVCNSALAVTGKDRSGVARADAAWDILQPAANAHHILTSLLAATAMRESDFKNKQEVLKGGIPGPGMGYFQLTNQPGVTRAQAFDLTFSANYAAKMLSDNGRSLSKSFPSLNPAELMHATATSYNRGLGGTRDALRSSGGDTSKIDSAKSGGNYGGNVGGLMVCFPFP